MGKDKERLVQALDLAGKLLKNIIENPTEEKFRTVRRENPKIKEKLTKYKEGTDLIKLLGFQESKE